MKAFNTEKITGVHHWNENLFSFTSTRNPGFRFKNGHFTMIGLQQESGPLMRAYSIASANHEEEMEFFSIKVADGPLTSKLQNLAVGDQILVSQKPTGTLITDDLLPGKHLYLLSTGTGLAPFISIIKDPQIYENYDRIILTHSVRWKSDLAYQDLIENELPGNPYFGDILREKLRYYPTVTREPYRHNGRLTALMKSGKLFLDLGLPRPNIEDDRFMICGGPAMLKDLTSMLNNHGFVETRRGVPGQFVTERAFVD